jgi:hypothetical protein
MSSTSWPRDLADELPEGAMQAVGLWEGRSEQLERMVEEVQREVLTRSFRPMVDGRPDYEIWADHPPVEPPV